MPALTIIIGSTRPGRAGPPIGEWFTECAKARGGLKVALVDLAQLDLPLLDGLPRAARRGAAARLSVKSP